MGQPNQTNEMPLCPQFMSEPSEKWTIDFIGPLNMKSSNNLLQNDQYGQRLHTL